MRTSGAIVHYVGSVDTSVGLGPYIHRVAVVKFEHHRSLGYDLGSYSYGHRLVIGSRSGSVGIIFFTSSAGSHGHGGQQHYRTKHAVFIYLFHNRIFVILFHNLDFFHLGTASQFKYVHSVGKVGFIECKFG